MNLNSIIFILIIIYLYCSFNNFEFFISKNIDKINKDLVSKCDIYEYLFNMCYNDKSIVCQKIHGLLSSCDNTIDIETKNKLKDIITQVTKEKNEDLDNALYALDKSIKYINLEQDNNNLKKKILNMLDNNKNIKISDNIKDIIASSLTIYKISKIKTKENIDNDINNITNNNISKQIGNLIIQ
tara:strand:+ start:3793 stop:4344 length:552 start_codon:yes stop_codon:yes gene_type:complete